tara:strand:- start:3661 stop:4170 length:510 start_codon:yes stop_codon:yes gene_type:complete
LDDKQILELLEEAEKKGENPKEYLARRLDEIKSAEREAKKEIQVQILPRNTIAGHGRYPAIVWMSGNKARDLAELGKVKLICDEEDIIDEEDAEAVAQHLDEMMEIRRSSDKKMPGSARTARLTNIDKERRRREGGEVPKNSSVSGEGSKVKPDGEERPVSRRTSRRNA